MKDTNLHFFIPNTCDNFEATSLVDICLYRAKHQPHQLAYRFLSNGIDESDILTYRSLRENASTIANALSNACSNNLPSQVSSKDVGGGNALLLYPSGLDYVSAFFACLYAGVIAIPAYPVLAQTDSQRLRGVIRDAKPRVILTLQSHIDSVSAWLKAEGLEESIQLIATDTLQCQAQNTDYSNIEQAHSDKSQEIAFLQYTSGSTGHPKGVVITHSNLLHNLQQIYRGFSHSEKSVGVIWLPPYHDMGLIGGLLQPLYGGFPVNIMSPMTFLRRPIRWLQAIDKYRGTTSGGPNFAFDLCVKHAKEKQLENLDLSCWDVAFSGAEPIREKTLHRFYEVFKGAGFQYSAYYPCYGLAESALMVSGVDKSKKPSLIKTTQAHIQQGIVENIDETDDSDVILVGSGVALDADIKIIDPKNLTELPDNRIGEIWVNSLSIAQGYWQNSKQTKITFSAYTSDKQGPYMRTGDLGFLVDQQLYVTGRLKELIILNGRNYFPNDIEETVQDSDSILRKGCGTAFSVEADDTEKLVVVQEIEKNHLSALDFEKLEADIVRVVACTYKITPFDVVLVKKSTLPKTTSGKLKRIEIKRRYLNGSIEKDRVNLFRPSGVSSFKHPMLQFKLLSTDAEMVFEGTLDKKLLADFSQHRLKGAAIVPGSAYVEVASYLGELLYGKGEFCLKQLSINHPCFIRESFIDKCKADIVEVITLNYQLRRHHDDGWFLMINQVRDDGGFQFLSRCIIQQCEPVSKTLTFEGSLNTISIKTLYQNLGKHGFSYGDVFRRVKKIEVMPSGVVAKLNNQDDLNDGVDFILNPYIVDSGFQLFATLPETFSSNVVYLPVSVGSIMQIGQLAEEMKCYIRSVRQNKNMLIADMVYTDMQGNVIIEMNCVKLMAQISRQLVLPQRAVA